jgi:two-component system cell cycle sensor histidine kinase/response regulator CckA
VTSIPAEIRGASNPAGRALSPAAGIYIAAVVAVALIVALPALSRIDRGDDWTAFVVLGALAAVAWRFVVPTGRNHGFFTSIVFLVAAALLLPLELAVLMGVVQHALDSVPRRYPWYIQVFNIANCTVNVAAAWGAAQLVLGLEPTGTGFLQALAGLAAVIALVGLNHLLLGGALRFARGHSLRATGLFAPTALAMDLVLGLLGVALAALWRTNPWLIPAVVGPLVLSQHSFSLLARLRESEQQFRAMFESAAVGSALVDLEGKVVSSNRALVEMLGYKKSELEATMTSALLHPDDAAREREFFDELVSGSRESYRTESRYVARDGTTVWGQVGVALVRSVDDKPRFAIRMVQDMTERKQAEEALRRSEELYRELFENANDIVFTLDLQGNFTGINRAGERITGYARAELLGRNIAELIAPESDEAEYALTGTGDAHTFQCSLVARDGRRVPIEVASRVVHENDQPVGVQGIARDVSERHELEERLRQAQKMEAVGLLAGGVAHDFNNMLTAITGYSHLAVAALDSGRGVRRSDIEEIAKASDRAAALTSQLLAFSRKQILRPQVLDLNDVVGEMDKMLRRLIGEQIDVVTAFGAGVGHVKADRGQLEQVILNLAVNARDAMPDGGKLVIETSNADPDPRAPEARPGPHVVLTVTDTGVGMDDETRTRIFEPFFTTKDRGQGTGLGLATVYGVVKQSGGHISVESEPGQGTTFRIYLPSVDEPVAEAKEGMAPVPAAEEASETILLVEDEEIVRQLVRDTLRASGYQVVEASDGAEALQICERRRDPIDIVVTDVVMPNMTGPELVERLSAENDGLRVLYVSGYTDGQIAQRSTSGPGRDLLLKPFTPRILAAKVRELLDAPGNVAA